MKRKKKINLPSYMLGSQVKEYNAPSHSKGGQNIDANGNPTTNGIAEIEKKETLISEGMDKKYIMSDYLGTSKELKKQLSKVKGSDPISRATRQHIFNKFKRLNEAKKNQVESTAVNEEMKKGGYLKNKNTYVTKDGKETKRGLWANVYLKKKKDKSKSKKMTLGGNPLNASTDYIKSLGFSTMQDYDKYLKQTGQFIEPLNGTINDITSQTATPVDISGSTPAITNPFSSSLRSKLSALGTNTYNRLNDFVDNTNVGDVGTGARLGSLAIAGARAFSRPEVEKEIYGDYSAGTGILKNQGIDNQALLNQNQRQAAASRRLATSSSRNFGNVVNRIADINSGLAASNNQARLQAKQYNDGVDRIIAQRQDRISQENRSEKVRTNVVNAQNRAAKYNEVTNFLTSVGQFGSDLEKRQYIDESTAAMNEKNKKDFLLNILKIEAANPNTEINKDLLQKIVNGDVSSLSADEMKDLIIKFRN